MGVIACPNCAARLRLADGSTVTSVRCPKCKQVFAPPRATPAFEVVDDPAPTKPAAPPPPAKASTGAPAFEVVDDPVPTKPAAPPPPAKASASSFNFDAAVSSSKPKSKPQPPRAEAEDSEDEDADDDFSFTSKNDSKADNRSYRRDRDEDEEDEDRPRNKKRKYGRGRDKAASEEDSTEARGKRIAGAGAAKIGMLLLTISLVLYFGTFALLGIYALLAWIGAYIPSAMMIIPGLLGIGTWLTGGVGFGFCIAGPARARGLAIAAASVAAVHLILGVVVANNTDSGMYSPGIRMQAVGLAGKLSRVSRMMEDTDKKPSEAKTKELRDTAKDAREFAKEYKDEIEEIAYYMGKLSTSDSESSRSLRSSRNNRDDGAPTAMRWADLATQLPFFSQFLDILSYHNKTFSNYLLAFFAGVSELALIVLTVLLIASTARSVNADRIGKRAMIGFLGVCIAAGLALVFTVLCGALADSARSDQKKIVESMNAGGPAQDMESATKRFKEVQGKIRSAQRMEKNAFVISLVLVFMIYSGMLLLPALAALQTFSAAGRRAR